MSTLQKTNRLLQIFVAAFLLIAFRIWHLAVIQREEKLIEAHKPQRRTLVQRADRGSITDRFGVPMAVNRICYNAAIYYNQFAQVPSIGWRSNPDGTRARIYPRKEYVKRLSELLSKELSMDPGRIEDLIHAKASLFPHVPFVIRSNISEKQHYRLKAAEREWPGLHAEIASERFYPLGKTAANILGHPGSISQREYVAIAGELELLHQMISEGDEEESIIRRYQELKEKAYTINDLVGKTGIEKQYEKELRGFYGKRTFEIDQKGNSLRELPGSRDPVPGQTVVLSISAELQQFCESLLIQDEKARDGRSIGINSETKTRKGLKQPWIKGGAIVAIDPNTGEVLAMAGTPRFDPNDFIPTSNREGRTSRVHRWQESDRYIGNLWDGKELLYRERPAGEEFASLTWETYLNWTLPTEGPLRAIWNRIDDLKTAIHLQEDFEALLYFANHSEPAPLIDALFPNDRLATKSKEALEIPSADAAPHRRRIEAFLSGIPSNADKLFALDLCRLFVYSPAFTDELIRKVGSLKISAYRSLTQAIQRIEEIVREQCREQFHATEFRAWRAENQKNFLKELRESEKERKTYARPYIDYLDQKERELFDEFWQKNRFSLLTALLKQDESLASEEALPYFNLEQTGLKDWAELRAASAALDGPECVQWLKTMRSFKELNRPLWSFSRAVRGRKGEQTERDLAAAFYPKGGFGFCRSQAFQSAAPLGSIFKVVTACAALRQQTGPLSPNFLTISDEVRFDEKKTLIVATSSDHKPFYRHYKGGRLPRSHLPNLGKVDLLSAIEQTSNPYFSILAGDFLAHPNDLARMAADFGFGERSGIDLPGEFKGAIPTDLETNRTGLYSFAIGQHTLVVTPLQTASMLASLANGGQLLTPRLAHAVQGIHPDRSALSSQSTDSQEDLAMLGIDFPLFTALAKQEEVRGTEEAERRIRRSFPLPNSVRNLLFEGMDRVVWGQKGTARPNVIKGLYGKPLLQRDYLALQHQMIGKTSTAEVLCQLDCNPSSLPQMYKHIWFGSIAFSQPTDPLRAHKERWENPELAVAVYLRFGDGGKEAAPLAAQVITKWREIQNRHKNK